MPFRDEKYFFCKLEARKSRDQKSVEERFRIDQKKLMTLCFQSEEYVGINCPMVTTLNIEVPPHNLAVYKLLYSIEVGLRELIIESLESACGTRWWKERLPGDILKEYSKAIDYERNIKWLELVSHHPLYYVEFTDLKKIIERRDNWKEVFEPVFGRKEILVSTLSKTEPIRNKIAHNRKVTKADLDIVQAAHQTITTAVGKKRFDRLVARCTLAEDLTKVLSRLRIEAKTGFESCTDCCELKQPEVWEYVKDKWWFDEAYLDCSLEAIKEYFSSLCQYSKLPLHGSRGSGYEIQTWVRTNRLSNTYAEAEAEFQRLFDGIGGRDSNGFV